MPDLLSIAGNSVKTNQAALAVVGNNIANANTDGYVRQELDIRENLPTRAGTVYLGSGALSSGVKRAYDSLVESSLRSSFSDLTYQTPINDLTNRVIDVLGSEKASLSPAIDDFFSGFRDLALDPSSQLRRDSALSEAQGLVSRFNEVGTQLKSLDSESMEALKFRVTELNSVVSQLSLVNDKLGRQSKIESQPADLLNTRDALLQDLSGLIKTKVTEQSNGQITVTIGGDSDGLVLVTKGSANQIGLSISSDALPNRVDLVLNPNGRPQNLSGITGGEIGGYLSFRDTTLKVAVEQINALADSLATEVNNVLSKGMDLYGSTGSPLFDIQPRVVTDSSFVRSNATITAAISSPTNFKPNALSLMFDEPNKRWLVTDLVTTKTFSANSVNNFSANGINFSVSGQPKDGDTVSVSTQKSQAENIRLAISDSKKIAAGELFGITLGSSNTGNSKGAVSAVVSAASSSGVSFQSLLVNNPHESASSSIAASNLQPSFTIPSGTADLDLSLIRASTSEAEVQVFTREGVHLFGTGDLSDNNLTAILTSANGFESTAVYSKNYLNQGSAYLNKNWALGATGKSIILDASSGGKEVKTEAKIVSNNLPVLAATGAQRTLVASNALSLNGVSLGAALILPSSTALEASHVVNWLESDNNISALGLSASAETIINVPFSKIDFTSSSLSINGDNVSISPLATSVADLANKINSASISPPIVAEVGLNQELVIKNAPGGNPSTSITFGASAGVLPLTGEVRPQIKIQADRSVGDVSDKVVTLSRNANATSEEMAVLGFRETLSLNGTLEEDLIVFTTGATNDGLGFYAGYSASKVDPFYQRDKTTEVKFTSASKYQIVDKTTNTVISERTWTLGSKINYGSFSLAIEGQPNPGDVFTIDGNQSGVASNENAMRIANIENSRGFGTGQTIKESYLSILTSAGNVSRRSSVAKEALDVVYQQAVEAKDSRAGVNLDEEAADLLRFQQAYQASAKVMQMANQLFDSILRI
jgi:flagellar hook-associated protein 1 FlgK